MLSKAGKTTQAGLNALRAEKEQAERDFDKAQSRRHGLGPQCDNADPRGCEISRSREIPARMESLQSRLGHAFEALLSLRERMSPVLRIVPTGPGGTNQAQADTPLGASLGDTISMVDRLITELTEIHEALEL